MERELNIKMNFYLTMEEGETEQEAEERFCKLMDRFTDVEDQKGSYQVHETEVQEF